MKTKNIHVKKLCKLIGLVLLLTFVLVSCKKGYTPKKYSQYVANPIYLTAEAQTQDTMLVGLVPLGIGAENPETDEVYKDNVQTATSNTSIEIKNDWITLNQGGAFPLEIIRITVKKNMSNAPRSYEATTRTHVLDGRLLIIQKGRGDNYKIDKQTTKK